MKRLAAWVAGLLLLGASGLARADALPPNPADEAKSPERPTLNVRAAPIFGSDAASGNGWNEIVVTLDNVGADAKKGTIELSSVVPWGREERFLTRAPFHVVPGRSAIVRLPTHGFPYQTPTLNLVVKGDDGAVFADTTVALSPSTGPLLVDVSQPSRLGVILRSHALTLAYNPASSSTYAPSAGMYGRTTLTVGAPTFDRTTGDPILPEHAASYAPVTVVLLRSDTLARLEGPALSALADWVIGGGTLAVVPARPEDLRSGPLPRFVGGPVVASPPPPFLLSLPTTTPTSPDGLDPMPLPTPDDEGGDPGPFDELETTPDVHPVGYFLPARTVTRPGWSHLGPSPEVREKLSGYLGGNLAASVYGASAAYGTGEVHLLPFDPTESPALDDPWVQSRIIDLVQHAWDRRASNVMPLGEGARYLADTNEVRRALDPNENFRPALGISAILLVLYSILAGPVTFMRAAKRGKPLAPLKWAPLWAAGTFGAIVLVGLAGKGWRGRARHIALVEAGAGVGRGSIRRFRGFFASETRSLSIPANDTSGLLMLATTDSAAGSDSSLKLDRDGATLENITSLPWQTIVVREDGMTDVGAGVSILPGADGSVDVVNHTGRELDDLLVYVPGEGVHYFEQLADGARLHAPDGRLLTSTYARRSSPAGTASVHPLDAQSIGTTIGGAAGRHVGEAWQPVESAAGSTTDWLPDGVPVVMAEIHGGEGSKRDSGLSIESDRTLLRVVGRGGAP